MIYILHGDDTYSAYLRLSQILREYQNLPKYYAKNENTAALNELINTQDIASTKKLIIAENFISAKKVQIEKIQNFTENILIFFEKKELKIKSITKIQAKIELFKLPSTLFYFLDSLNMPAKSVISKLSKLDKDNQDGLMWNIQNRLFLLILAKLNYSRDLASKITERNLQDWQWAKIQNQAKSVELEKLKHMFSSSLRIDYLIKSGKTNMGMMDLLPLLFMKYSRT